MEGRPYSRIPTRNTNAQPQPVIIAPNQTAIPITGSISATNPSVGILSATSPASATLIGGNDGSGKLQASSILSLTDSKALTVAIVDANGDQIISFGGGTQYTDAGTPPAHPIGNDLVFNNAGAWAQVTNTTGLPVAIIGTPSVTATLSTETTKIIGTVNIASGQVVGLSAGSQVIGHVIVDSGTVTTVSNLSQIASTTPTFGDINNSAAEAGVLNVAPIGRYNATQPTLTDTRYNQLQVSGKGELLVSPGVSNFAVQATLQTQTDSTMIGGINIKEIAGVAAATIVVGGTSITGAGLLGTAVAIFNGSSDYEMWSSMHQQGDGNDATRQPAMHATIFNNVNYDRTRSAINATNSIGTGIQAVGILAQFDDVSPTSITENQFGNIRMSANRDLYSTIRDAAGSERGINVDANGGIPITIEAAQTLATVTTVGTVTTITNAVSVLGSNTGSAVPAGAFYAGIKNVDGTLQGLISHKAATNSYSWTDGSAVLAVGLFGGNKDTGVKRYEIVDVNMDGIDPVGYPSMPTHTFNTVFNGTSWDRQRIPTIFKTATATASGDTACWTPATGKKFRLMRYMIGITGDCATSGGAEIDIILRDATTGTAASFSIYVPATSVTTNPSVLGVGWVDLGNGILSALANNVLNINLSATLTAGKVRVVAIGTEE